MGLRHAAVMTGLALGLMPGVAKASLVFDIRTTFLETDVYAITVTGSGSLDTDKLSDYFPTKTSISPPGVDVEGGGYFYLTVGYSTQPMESQYQIGLDKPLSLGTPGAYTSAFDFNTYSGNLFGLFGRDAASIVYLPLDYVSGTQLGTSTNKYVEYSDSPDFGFTQGSTVYKVTDLATGSSTGDTITVNINVSTVPLPASAPMFGAALMALGAVGYGLKRKGKAAAAA